MINFPETVEIIEEGFLLVCPKCGSTAKRRFIFFGKKYCINSVCGWKEK